MVLEDTVLITLCLSTILSIERHKRELESHNGDLSLNEIAGNVVHEITVHEAVTVGEYE
jgi:hypothetical protein